MNHLVTMSFKQMIADLPLYIRSFFSETAIYRASYIEQEVRSIGSKSAVSFRLHPVLFATGDRLNAPQLAEAEVIPGSSLIRTRILGDLIYDENNKILYFLEARLVGKKEQTSRLDIRQNRKRKARKILAFLAHLIRYDGDNVKLRSIRNKPPVNYRNVVCYARPLDRGSVATLSMAKE